MENGFLDLIIKNLNNNGFPEKRVSLPLEKLYESAEDKGINLNGVLQRLADERMIGHEKNLDKIVFYPLQNPNANPFSGMDFGAMENMSKQDLFAKAQEMMSQMSPEQLAEIQKMYSQMTPEQREEIMRKGRAMGIS